MADNSFYRSFMMMYEERQLQAMRAAYHNALRRSFTVEPQTEPLMNHKTTHPYPLYQYAETEPVTMVMVESLPNDANRVMKMENGHGHQTISMPNVSHQLLSQNAGDPIGVDPNGFAPATFSLHGANNLMTGGSSAAVDVVIIDEEPRELDLTLRLAPPRVSLAISSNGSRANNLIAGGGVSLFGVKIGQLETPELDLTLRLDLPENSLVMSSNGTRANGVRMEEVEPAELDLTLSL